MRPDPRKIAISEHQRWMGYLQPEGLVVSALALVDSQVQLDTGSYAAAQERFRDGLATDPDSGQPVVENFAYFARDFLGWKNELLDIYSVSAEVPDVLRVSTGEHGEILQPDAAYRFFKPSDPVQPVLLLVQQLPLGTELDELPIAKKERGWVASPHQKFERLLRETAVPIGVLCNGHTIRLVYAPKGENSGWLTFPVAFMTQIAGRAVASALELLLSHRRLITVPEALRLPSLLRKSRDYQAHVSIDLSHQVLEALFELGRGFQAADEKAKGALLADVWQRDPQEIYGGLISTLLRLVFLLYAEDKGLMPAGELYTQNYSVQGLFEQLRSDHERYPDTMDDRFGGWPRLLAVFRAVHGGCRHRKMTLPAREGHLFDPERFPFLEGRGEKDQAPSESLPRISDGTLYRVLDLLLYLDGERLSYRTLDVEQIGSVYETIMGFHVEKATGRMIALKPKKKHGAPVHLDLDDLLTRKPAERDKLLKDHADTKLPAVAAKALKIAASIDDLLAALDKRIDRRATPHPVPAGSIILQPTDERRRSGSHYTARSFTNPIVRKTLEPILDRLGRHPLPEVILDLKIADIAVGSAAFLVETCRQLADELTASWHFHKCLPVIPPDEDELLFARRLVAQRCLYGVDRNPMAVDLAKLSLWLATMAKDHPFTFLDHAIKCGDSLVGLTNRQIAAFHWDPTQAKDRVFGQEKLEQQIADITTERKRILDWTEDNEFSILQKQGFLAAAFLVETCRQQNRDEFLHRKLDLQDRRNVIENLPWEVNTLKQLRGGEHPIRPFHWEIEFPEVFSRENPGFDAIVGNPPFLGGSMISGALGDIYRPFIAQSYTPGQTGRIDLVAYFAIAGVRTLSKHGRLGIVCAERLLEGDGHRIMQTVLRSESAEIWEVTDRTPWPGEAAVVVKVIYIKKVRKGDQRISKTQDPVALDCLKGLSWRGTEVRGDGFFVTDDERSLLIEADGKNAEVISECVNGDDVNNRPDAGAGCWIINFGTKTFEDASNYHEPFRIVTERVAPYRATITKQIHEPDHWKYWDKRLESYEKLARIGRCLAVSEVTVTDAFVWVRNGQVLQNTLVLILLSSDSAFSVLQSSVHWFWVRNYCSAVGTSTIRYSPTKCFKTFPFPPDWETNTALESAGREYYEYRAALMVRNDEGLTKTYNRFHDPEERSPDIHQLRSLHAAMDRAVLAAYGWPDIPTACEFLLDYEEDEDSEDAPEAPGKKKGKKKKKPWRYRWPDEVRDEVLARLLALNAERHAEEVRLGIAPGMKSAKKKGAKKKTQRPKRDDELL